MRRTRKESSGGTCMVEKFLDICILYSQYVHLD